MLHSLIKSIIPLVVLAIAGLSSGYTAIKGIPLPEDPDISERGPNPETPVELKQTWLRFHEGGLCREIRAVFIFHAEKMEVWAIFENDKDYMKLFHFLKPLQNRYQIKLYKISVNTERKPAEIKTPPPSLWENMNLAGYFHSSFLPPTVTVDQGLPSDSLIPLTLTPPATAIAVVRPDNSWVYQQRLVLFARETLEYAAKMKQYSSTLIPLARFAFDPREEPELRSRALTICGKHVQEMRKLEQKLSGNLSKTLQGTSERKSRADRIPGAPETAHESAPDLAVRLAAEAKDLYDGVDRLIYPTDHTVTMEDLRHPPLIRALAIMRSITDQLNDAFGAPGRMDRSASIKHH